MNRRNFLGMLAAIPFVGKLLPSKWSTGASAAVVKRLPTFPVSEVQFSWTPSYGGYRYIKAILPRPHRCKCGWLADGLFSTASVSETELLMNSQLDGFEALVRLKKQHCVDKIEDLWRDAQLGRVKHFGCGLSENGSWTS